MGRLFFEKTALAICVFADTGLGLIKLLLNLRLSDLLNTCLEDF